MQPLRCVDLGRRSYGDTLELQRALRLERLSGHISEDLLLLVEHDPVYTLGRSTRETSLPLAADALKALGADVVEIERGGDVTWHGPGQLVGYPIIDLTGHRQDLHWYLRTLEQAVIDALAAIGIAADARTGQTGVWTRGAKIASIGIHVKQWVTLHGFALNVTPDLGWFEAIVPCGIHGVRMTSVAAELNVADEAELGARCRSEVALALGNRLSREPVPMAIDDLLSAIETPAQGAPFVSVPR